MEPTSYLTGIELLQKQSKKSKDWGNCALLCNQASIDRNYQPAWKILSKIIGPRLKVLFGPQHGFTSVVQDNMIESPHATHPVLGIPVFSLYSETREPTKEMLREVDTIVVDLQIVGCRIYTYKYSLAGCMRAAKKYGKKVVVLDRINPLGGVNIEGSVLNKNMKSFVGEFAIPMRHGLTAGEAARFFNQEIDCDLEVVRLDRWDPNLYLNNYPRPWILTSPNLPTMDSVLCFPATVMLEGTNISEGRGTSLPLQIVGAPYVKDADKLVSHIQQLSQGAAGFFLRPTTFEPCFQKWSGKTCQGFQLHPTDPKKMKPFYLGLAIIRAFIEMYPEDFSWKQPPYEYELTKLPFDVIMGMNNAHKLMMDSHFNIEDSVWSEGLDDYSSLVSSCLLYDRNMQINK